MFSRHASHNFKACTFSCNNTHNRYIFSCQLGWITNSIQPAFLVIPCSNFEHVHRNTWKILTRKAVSVACICATICTRSHLLVIHSLGFLNLHHPAYKSMGFGRCAHPRKKSCFSSLYGSHLPDYVMWGLHRKATQASHPQRLHGKLFGKNRGVSKHNGARWEYQNKEKRRQRIKMQSSTPAFYVLRMNFCGRFFFWSLSPQRCPRLTDLFKSGVWGVKDHRKKNR